MDRQPNALDRPSTAVAPIQTHLSKALEATQRALYLSDTDRHLIRVYLRQIEDEMLQHERRDGKAPKAAPESRGDRCPSCRPDQVAFVLSAMIWQRGEWQRDYAALIVSEGGETIRVP